MKHLPQLIQIRMIFKTRLVQYEEIETTEGGDLVEITPMRFDRKNSKIKLIQPK